jgi:hypothetical protein
MRSRYTRYSAGHIPACHSSTREFREGSSVSLGGGGGGTAGASNLSCVSRFLERNVLIVHFGTKSFILFGRRMPAATESTDGCLVTIGGESCCQKQMSRDVSGRLLKMTWLHRDGIVPVALENALPSCAIVPSICLQLHSKLDNGHCDYRIETRYSQDYVTRILKRRLSSSSSCRLHSCRASSLRDQSPTITTTRTLALSPLRSPARPPT